LEKPINDQLKAQGLLSSSHGGHDIGGDDELFMAPEEILLLGKEMRLGLIIRL